MKSSKLTPVDKLVKKTKKTTKSTARSLCFSSTRDIFLRIQSRFSQRRFQSSVEKLGSPGGWWKYYKYSQVRTEREECADRIVCTFCLDSQDLGSPNSNKHHSSLNVWTCHWVIFLSLTATCLILRPWTRGCRDTWGLWEDCRFAAACRQKRPSVLQPGDMAQAEGKQPFSAKTRPSGNPALYPNSWTFLLFIGPHMTWHIILKRFWPVKHHLLLLIFVITLRQKNIHPSCKKYK